MKGITVELRRLNHLVALADERNFARAAARCHLSQPAFSRSIQAIESELGLPLFDRGTTEARPTPGGALVIERARKLLFESRCLERDVGLFRQRLFGDIAFGAGPYPAATLLPGLLTAIRRQHPAIKVRLEVNNWDALAQHLRAEDIEFFVADTRSLPQHPDLEITPLARQMGAFFVRQGHPLLAYKKVSPLELVPFGLATVRLPELVREQVLGMLGLPADAALPLALECDDVHLLKHVALETDTVLAASHALVDSDVRHGLLARLNVSPLPALYAEMGIVSLKGRTHAPMAQFVIESLQARAGGAAAVPKPRRTAAKSARAAARRMR